MSNQNKSWGPFVRGTRTKQAALTAAKAISECRLVLGDAHPDDNKLRQFEMACYRRADQLAAKLGKGER